MRLLIIQDYLRHGGTESHAVWLAGALRASGVDAEILTFRPGGALLPRAGAAGILVTSLQRKDSGFDWHAPGLAAAVKARRPDAVLLMGKMANARARGLRKALPAGTRLVGSVRTGRRLPWFVRRALPACDVVVCNACAVAGALPAFGVPSDKIIVIPNPPVTAPLPQDGAKRDSVRQRHGASGSDRVLLCVAGFRPGKGQDALIRTLARTPESSRLVLWLVGDGDTRAACEALAKNIGVAGRVRFLGHAADPRELYLAADLAVMASAAEALPNFLIEAQLHGVPVATWDIGGVKETFLPASSGALTPPGDETALAAAWVALTGDVVRLAAFSVRARDWAPTVFSEAAALIAYRKVFGS